jgi:hypothetical protein
MTATEEQLLPHDPAYRCSPWTKAQGVGPIGSTPTFDAVVLVEWPLPWPHDVSDIPDLADAAAVPGVRVMMVVPQHDDAGDALVRVVHHRRVGTNRLVGIDHRAPRSEVRELLAVITADPLADHLGLPSVVGASPPEVLVCAHGRRDACCGRWGTLLHMELADRWTGVRVWRCSHTGGHRFAPTAITLPDGRAWAYVDSTLLDGIVHRTADLHELAAHDRGTSSLDPWSQVVERAVFEERGWAWLDQDDVEAHTELHDDRQGATVTLTWEGGSARAEVEITRVLPVLVCGQPPEQARKSSPEYAVRDLQIT